MVSRQPCGTSQAEDGTPLVNTKTFPSLGNMTAHGHALGLRVRRWGSHSIRESEGRGLRAA